MTDWLIMDPNDVMLKLHAFSEGRLLIWSPAVQHQDRDGYVQTVSPEKWLEVRDASAIFVRDAKYKIAEKRWRVPTDEEAERRPVCRVRDCKNDNWKHDCILVAVCSREQEEYPFFVQRSDGWIEQFVYCEIEEESTDAIS